MTRFCHYPPEACLKPKIGDYVNPDLEAIAALKPDLVIVQTNPVRLSERLHALHLQTIEVDQRDIPAIYKSIRMIGDAAGVPDRATKLIDSIRGDLDRIRARAAALPKVRTMFIVGRSPGRLDGLFIAGGSSFLNDLIQIAGGENVFHDAAGAYPSVSLEEVIARNPQVIIDMGDMSNTENITEAHQREVIALWGRMSSIEAVKQRRVFPIASDIYRRARPARGRGRARDFRDAASGWLPVKFQAAHVGFAYGLRDATFELAEPGLVAIAGPNGAGKSTLLGIMAGLRSPYSGSCAYAGIEVRRWRRRDFARRVAFLPQMLRLEFPFTAEQVVMMSRTPYGGGWFESPEDHIAVERAMATTDTLAFRSRDFRALSGGERQRVILASALAQQPETLLLDEPTTFLDLKHQLDLYRLLAALGRARNTGGYGDARSESRASVRDARAAARPRPRRGRRSRPPRFSILT